MIGWLRAAKLVAFALVIGFIGFQPGSSPEFNSAAGPTQNLPGVPTTPGGVTDPGTSVPGAPTGPQTGPTTPDAGGPSVPSGPVAPSSNLTCDQAGNGGETDVGVTANSIKLASTMVQSGDGKTFLQDSPIGMEAVIRRVNSQGGICGRLLRLELVDDGWQASRGLGYIKNFIAEGNFALPVVPSSEGLTAAIEAKEISKAGIPVIGTDGMLKQQYEDPWVWPVATASVSTMRVIARHAYKMGARCFGIVWDTRYRFGKEGEQAFVDYVNSMPGAKVCADQGIVPGQASYSNEINEFNKACNNKCEAIALLLEPGTAYTWMKGRPQQASIVTSGAQTLFSRKFATDCAELCAGMLMWTGYNPPIGNLAALPGVKQYVQDVTAVSSTVDYENQFLEGAYLGMTIFVEALKAVGPELTRARLAQVMNSKTFRHDIAVKLQWSGAERHANCQAQAFRVVVTQGSFQGFADAQTGFIQDPVC